MKKIQLKIKLQQFLSRCLVRLKWVKSSPVDIDEIGQLINKLLPTSFELATPVGEGKLTLLGATLTIAPSTASAEQDCIHTELLCSFSVKVKQNIIYNTHLMIILEAQPNYYKQQKRIGVKDVRISQLELISDQYSLIKDTSSLMGGLIPKSLKSLVDITLFSTKAIFNTKTVSSMTKYLSIYTSGSKQKVLDFHRHDIEEKVIQLSQDVSNSYPLNQDNFEEKLFSDFGEKIIIENSKLMFVFSH